MKRLHREHRILYAITLQPGKRFRNEATSGVIALYRVERCKRKNVEGSTTHRDRLAFEIEAGPLAQGSIHAASSPDGSQPAPPAEDQPPE
jgi:hypothetical protein